MYFKLELGCSHPEVGVVRFHRDVVRTEMRGKLLYVDEHNVHCFVQCHNCKAYLKGRQTERLFAEK